MRRPWAPIAVVLACLALLGASATGSSTQSRTLGPDQHLDRLRHRVQAAGAQATTAATLDHFKLVGHSALDGFGDYGDLFAHGHFAYVGSRCGDQAQGGDGPPGRAALVGAMCDPNPPKTTAYTIDPTGRAASCSDPAWC